MKGIGSWFSPKVAIRPSRIAGKGLFATAPIAKDEVVAIKSGHIISQEAFSTLPDACKQASLQVADTLFVAPLTPDEIPLVMNYINHSCDPNVGLRGHLETVAMRDIAPGEELTGDYCIAYSDDFFQFSCGCGSQRCRAIVTSEDWKALKLQQKYKGYFCQYMQTKIDQMSLRTDKKLL